MEKITPEVRKEAKKLLKNEKIQEFFELFFANVDKQEIPYNELADLSLRIYPSVVNDENIGVLNNEY